MEDAHGIAAEVSATKLAHRRRGCKRSRVRLLDANNLYSPTGGGVRTYHERKLAWVRQHPVHEAALIVPGERESVERDGNTVRYEVPSIPLGSSGYRLIVRAGALRRAIEAFAPDVIEVGSAYIMPQLVRRALRGRQVPTVGFYHADYPDTYVAEGLRSAPAPLREALVGAARRHAGRQYEGLSATFAASEHVLRKLSAWGVRRLFRTPLGVDVERFSPLARDASLREAVGVAPGAPLFVYVGRLADEKGLSVLLEAWPAIAQARPGAVLVVAGHGPLADRVDALAAAAPGVVRRGFLPDPGAVAALLEAADALVLPGPFETFSLTTLEALACGTPVLAPDAGGAGELARRFGLPTFAADDAASLARLAAAVAPRDEAVERALRTRVVAEYSWDAAFARQFRYHACVAAAVAEDRLDSLVAHDGDFIDDPLEET